ncbi:hypothetical protein TSAR_016834, partial [Trichomalopsis sarcophagae]
SCYTSRLHETTLSFFFLIGPRTLSARAASASRLPAQTHRLPELQELLGSKDLLKVGVASFDDEMKIAKDYDCQVVGTVVLRMLTQQNSLPSSKSLAELCVYYLNSELDTILEVKYSNWNKDSLTVEQMA